MTVDLEQALAQVGDSLRKLADGEGHELAIRLARLFAVIAQKAATTKSFSRDLLAALGNEVAEVPATKRPHRRQPGPIDPFEVFTGGEEELRRELLELDIEELKDIIAEHAMDRDRLAMKWKTPERLIERIVETVQSRTAKGEAFRK